MEFPNEIESEDEERDMNDMVDSRDLCLEYIRNALNSVPDDPSDEDTDEDSEKNKIENKPESIQNSSQSSVVIFQQGIDWKIFKQWFLIVWYYFFSKSKNEFFQSRVKDDDTNKINESLGPVMNSTFQNDELRSTLKETVNEVLNDTGVLNGVRILL